MNMQVYPNFKNLAILVIGAFFVYLIYLLWGNGTEKLPEMWIDINELINYSVLAAHRGGLAVGMIHQEKQLMAKSKGKTKEGRDEFVTKADLISNQLIMDTLSRLPGIKTVSEEKTSVDASVLQPYLEKTSINNFLESQSIPKDFTGKAKISASLNDVAVWIDPLDATQEYTEDLLEYVTVMVCIAVRGRPRVGIIHRPFQKQTVIGIDGVGVYPSLPTDVTAPNKIVVSRSHAGKVKSFSEAAFGADSFEIEPAGGAGYKTLRVLNSTAALYIHKTAIKKWDICAGDAIIRAGGGRMTTLYGNDIDYFANDPKIVNEKGLLVALKNPFTYLAKVKTALEKEKDN